MLGLRVFPGFKLVLTLRSRCPYDHAILYPGEKEILVIIHSGNISELGIPPFRARQKPVFEA